MLSDAGPFAKYMSSEVNTLRLSAHHDDDNIVIAGLVLNELNGSTSDEAAHAELNSRSPELVHGVGNQ